MKEEQEQERALKYPHLLVREPAESPSEMILT